MEHALAGGPGLRIRMKNGRTGVFEWVGGGEAKEIRRHMAVRVSQLKEEMRVQGLHIQDADCPVRVGQEDRSVDVRLWSSFHGANALVEAKWTRRALEVATAWGGKSVPMLKKACAEGMWLRSRTKVKASAVGVLVVKPKTWSCTLQCVNGSRSTHFPAAAREVTRKKKSGKSQSGAQKRKGNKLLKAADKAWRKGKRGKPMTRKHAEEYRGTEKGKKTRATSNQKYYKKKQNTTPK